MNSIIKAPSEVCPKCGDSDAKAITFSDTIDFRGAELDVENLHESKCMKCGHLYQTAAQRSHNNSVARSEYAILRDKLRKEQQLLTGAEIAHIRELFSLNQRDASTIFGGGYNAFNKYESGEVLQSFAMDRLLRLTSAIGKPALHFLQNVFPTPSFVVTSSEKNGHLRISLDFGRHGLFDQRLISGTSDTQMFSPALSSPIFSSPKLFTKIETNESL